MKKTQYFRMKHRFLMCRPDYFDVEYEINPWMDVSKRPDKELAIAQWEALYQTYVDLGVHVELVEPAANQPDMVFTANAGLVYKNTFIPSQFKYKERKGEEPFFQLWFEQHGYDIVKLPKGMCFEGEADRIFRNGQVLMANGFRTDEKVTEEVARLLDVKVLQVNLVNPNFYHLDTCLAYFDYNDTILYYPDAFDKASQYVIEKEFPNVIKASHEEAYGYVCNSINVDNTIVLSDCCPKIKAQLHLLGYKVIELNTSEFMKAGGSIKCMTLKLS